MLFSSQRLARRTCTRSAKEASCDFVAFGSATTLKGTVRVNFCELEDEFKMRLRLRKP